MVVPFFYQEQDCSFMISWVIMEQKLIIGHPLLVFMFMLKNMVGYLVIMTQILIIMVYVYIQTIITKDIVFGLLQNKSEG